MAHSEQDPNRKFVFKRMNIRIPKERAIVVEELYNLHLQLRINRETIAVNHEILNNTVYRPRR